MRPRNAHAAQDAGRLRVFGAKSRCFGIGSSSMDVPGHEDPPGGAPALADAPRNKIYVDLALNVSPRQ